MEYVKEELSKLFRENYRALLKSETSCNNDVITIEQHHIHKKALYPRLRQLIYTSRLIMSMPDIEVYLMPNEDMCKLEKELCKPLNLE